MGVDEYTAAVTGERKPPDATIPPAIRRLQWWFVLGPVVWLGGAVLLFVPSIRSAMPAPNFWWGVGTPLVILAPHGIAMFFVVRGLRRVKLAVRACHGCACTHCVHDLTGLGDHGICPECGQGFDIAAGLRSWARVKMSA